MTGPACVVHDDELTRYDFGPGHPLAPVRVDLAISLARALGILDLPGLTVAMAPRATDEQLALIHEADYIAAVRKAGADPHVTDTARGLGTADNPAFAGMHEAAAHIAGATLEAARQVWTGQVLHAVNISGGLHHALAGSASGFCIYNDPAIAIAWLLDQGAERVAYVDIDVHHGDGVQAAFYNDSRVMTISLHEDPATLFPGTGRASESGGRGADGLSVNVALPPGTDDAGWLRAFHAVVPPLLRSFAPTVLVTQHGCDSHMDDPLAHLMLSVDGQRAAHLALHDLAHEVCSGKWLATGGGGYAVIDVVPRTWAHLLAIIGGSPLDPRTPVPAKWRESVLELTGRRPPASMTDDRSPRYRDWAGGYDPDTWLDRSIEQTRQRIFPAHGLDVSC
ncbi:MAG: acetoin utilization protein AcuC [Nocardioidaceae bacterium]|nr:acetoin utilization protein AcuC [Nocardioidaceae bacterium]